MNLYEIRNLTKTYGERVVLDIPALDFRDGLIYALLGPNGSGKTTLLEILGLLSPPTTGAIRYRGRPLSFRGNHLFLLRREMIIVHQNPILFSTTVYRNLEFGLKIRGIPKKERALRIKDALELVGMGSFFHAEAHNLSGGETQRVAIARALACAPKVLFFDEPTSNVDVENRGAIEGIVRQINGERGLSVIFTTHDMVQASRLSGHIISLFEGKQVPATVENIFSGTLSPGPGGAKTCHLYNRVAIALHTEQRGTVRLCIDPQDVRISHEADAGPGHNVFRGRLTQLSDETFFIRAVADIGIPLNVLVPKDAFDPSLRIGGEVTVSFPASAVQVFER